MEEGMPTHVVGIPSAWCTYIRQLACLKYFGLPASNLQFPPGEQNRVMGIARILLVEHRYQRAVGQLHGGGISMIPIG